MEAKDLHHLPVVDGSQSVIGIVTRRDLQLAARCYGTAPVEVSEVMHTPVITITPDSALRDAADRMRREGIGSLPVCDSEDGHLVGIITETDLLRALSELLAERAA
jgi:CBS domain-containing protein